MVDESPSLGETRALLILMASRRYGELMWSGKEALIRADARSRAMEENRSEVQTTMG